MHDFNGQEEFVCKLNNYISNNKYYIILEPNCSYSDTIIIQVLTDNLIRWDLYYDISFLSTNMPNKYKTIYESDSIKEKILKFNHLSNNNNDCLDVWSDIFYFSHFDNSTDDIGNYYVDIEKSNASTFATSFGNKEIYFNYKIEPYCNNDTLFLLEKKLSDVLVKITKVRDDYFIKNDLIKVYSDEIKLEKYGYKLKKGYLETENKK